jgi:hypothetical protein
MCNDVQNAAEPMERLQPRALYVGCAETICKRLLTTASATPHPRILSHDSFGTSSICAGALLSLWLVLNEEVPRANMSLFEALHAEEVASHMHVPDRLSKLAHVDRTYTTRGLHKRAASLGVSPTRLRTMMDEACPLRQLAMPKTSHISRQPQLLPDTRHAHSRIKIGYCHTTDENRGDCKRGVMGSLKLGPAHEIADFAACVAFCKQCSQCNYVSMSPSHEDCGWFHRCNGFDRSDVLEMDFGGETYISMKVNK